MPDNTNEEEEEATVPLTRLRKHQFIPFIDISSTSTPSWARIGKSTIFDLALNANTEDQDFIEDEMPTTEITYYKPTLPQELQTNAGDAAFDFIYEMFKSRPVGEAVKKSVLLVFAGTSPYDAWLTTSTIVLKDLNTVDQKINFDININKITDGTATVSDGVPSFTAAS